MSEDIEKFLKEQKSVIFDEKKRLGLFEDSACKNEKNCDNEATQNNNLEQSLEENKENVHINSSSVLTPNENQTLPFIEPLDLNSNRDSNNFTFEEKKQAFIDKLVNSENPLTNRSDDRIGCEMLRYGEYSPNNPELRVTAAAPYLGLGEYEQRRNYFLQKQRAEYLRHIAKKNENNRQLKKSISCESRIPESISENSNRLEKGVQTDIKNIQSRLIQYDLQQCENSAEKELSPRSLENILTQNNRTLAPYRTDQRLTTAQNALLNQEMDKPKSILSNRRTGSPRERLLSDGYTPSFMDGFSYQASRCEEIEREKLKSQAYQRELRLQIEEKHRLQQLKEDQERRQQEMENRRLEQQLLRMEEERMMEEQRRCRRDEQMRRHSEDLLRRKQELQSTRHSLRKHMNSESSVSVFRSNASDIGKPLSHYSPPVSRRSPYSFNVPSTSVFAEPTARYNPSRFDTYHRKDALNRMDSLNSYESPSRYNAFSRFDSLSRIDSLNQRLETMSLRDSLSDGQRRHSATQQDLSALKRSPRLQRRSSSTRFDDPLPIPVLKAHSPVAKELKNSIPFNSSRHSSDSVRKLEDKWQIPAVQKTMLNHVDSPRDGQKRSILTQLGAIRMQLQQEQLRMDETLRKRGFTQSKAVDFH